MIPEIIVSSLYFSRHKGEQATPSRGRCFSTVSLCHRGLVTTSRNANEIYRGTRLNLRLTFASHANDRPASYDVGPGRTGITVDRVGFPDCARGL